MRTGSYYLIDIDGKIPNLALHKIKKYLEKNGEKVEWGYPHILHIKGAFVSCLYPENKEKVKNLFEYIDRDCMEIGGSGWDLKKTLPEDIEKIKPKINLGYTSRGCPRQCGFCIVPEKEGAFKIVGNLLDLWDGRSRDIILLDNNILTDKKHFKKICAQARLFNIRLDFTQGLDHRLLTSEILLELQTTRKKDLRFSFDDPGQKESVKKALEQLFKAGIKRAIWYVLVGYNTTFKEDLERVLFLKSQGQTVFVQRFNKKKGLIVALARWANQHRFFSKMDFVDYLKWIAKAEGTVKYIGMYEEEMKNG